MSIDLNSPEVKAELEKMVAEATSGLVAKRDELLAEVKKLRKNQEIKPEQLEALEEQIETYKSQLTEAQKMTKQSVAELDRLKKAYETEASFNSKMLVDAGLTDAIAKAGVAPQYIKAVKSMLASQVQVKVEGDERKAVIGDKTLADFIGEWSKSDEGKYFIAAPSNSGGGSTGGGNAGGGVKTMPRTDFDKISSAEKAAFLKEGGKLID